METTQPRPVRPCTWPPLARRGLRLEGADLASRPSIAAIGEEDVSGSSVEGGASVVFDGLQLGVASHSHALRCEGPGTRVFVRRSRFDTDLGVGLSAKGCDIRIDRSWLAGRRGALRLEDTHARIENSVIEEPRYSDMTAVRVTGGSVFFRFVTVFGNTPEAEVPGAFDCGPSPVVIEDSIVAGNRRGPQGSQFAGACELSRVVVGTADNVPSSGAIRKEPKLDGYVLPRSAANLDCCIDKAKANPDIRTDYEGNPRPRGRGYDIGAHEAP